MWPSWMSHFAAAKLDHKTFSQHIFKLNTKLPFHLSFLYTRCVSDTNTEGYLHLRNMMRGEREQKLLHVEQAKSAHNNFIELNDKAFF